MVDSIGLGGWPRSKHMDRTKKELGKGRACQQRRRRLGGVQCGPAHWQLMGRSDAWAGPGPPRYLHPGHLVVQLLAHLLLALLQGPAGHLAVLLLLLQLLGQLGQPGGNGCR